MLTESAKKLRDPLALGLLGVTVLYLIGSLSVLFNGDLGEFSARAVMTQANFVAPVFVIVTVAAAMLVASSEPTPMARVVVPAALGIQGVMLLLGLITWFAGYGAETESAAQPNSMAAAMSQMAVVLVGFGGMAGAGKIVGTFLMLAYIGLLAIGAYLTFTVFQGLPAPVRPQQQQQQWGQQWGGQPQQQQWGQPQQQQQQWGQPQQQQQQQWGQPQQQQQQWGAAAGGAAAGQAWGQPASGESSTGYAAGGDPGQPAPGSGESSTGYAAGGDAGQQAPQWGQQPDPTQQWGQPQQQQPEAPQQGEQQQEGEDDRPGWWSPSS